MTQHIQNPIVSPLTIYQDLIAIRQQAPLIHNITNFVSMQTIANSLLAIGASPLMAHAKNELAEIISIANALIINIGTLDDNWLTNILYAQELANKKLIPIILDPVGAGATQYRTQATHTILKNGVDIIRGNASEIMALSDNKLINTKGVNATQDSTAALQAACSLAKHYNCIVVISGETDWIVNQTSQLCLHNGTALFTQVTGMGCAVTAIIGAFAAINKNYFKAAAYAMVAFNIAGEIAAQHAHGPGTFYIHLLDKLSQLNEKDLTILR